MLVLGIDTSCDDTSVAVVRDGTKVLSNIVSSQNVIHEKYGGIVPELACRKHLEIINFVIEKALKDAGDNTPAIYITALSDINSIAKGFEIGADDYIKKPFDPEELVIRIKRKYEQEKDVLLYISDIVYNPTTKVLKKAGVTIGLGDVQQNIFHTLMVEQNKIVNSYTLIDFLEHPSANALRVNLAKLKNKLGINIKNIRGQGYMIENL